MLTPFFKYEPLFMEALLHFGPPPKSGWSVWRRRVHEKYEYRFRHNDSLMAYQTGHVKYFRQVKTWLEERTGERDIGARFFYWWRQQRKLRTDAVCASSSLR